MSVLCSAAFPDTVVSPDMSDRNFFAELKRRNVVRMAGLYLVGAWLLTQVASTVLPMFGAPDWLPRSIVILVAIGFFPALIFSWVFELTSQGLRRDEEVAPGESIAPQTARRMNWTITAVLLLALAYFAFDKFVLTPNRNAALVAAASMQTTDAHSLAVLPFVNMSGDAANEYFSDGISEEILNVLARTPELRVAARTSSFSFKGKTQEVPEIARELNVRMVLEGSVRKQEDRVRITAQLIDAKTGFHVWSATYDRKLQDIFAIQDEIAKAIGKELEVKLVRPADPSKASAGTTNLAAYDLYLRGIALWQQRRGDALWQAIDLFEKAAAADPEFAQAYAGQALVYAVLGDYSRRIPYAESFARANNFAQQALALDPTLPEPYAALGIMASNENRRPPAGALLRRAIALRPSFATAHQWYGSLLMSSGDLAGALASMERASSLDPRSLVVADNHGWVLLALGRYAEAKARCAPVLEFAPDHVGNLLTIAMSDLLAGNFDAARPMLERAAAAGNPSASAQARELVDALAGRADRHAFAEKLAALRYNSNLDPASGSILNGYQIAPVLMLLGERELTLSYLETLAGELGGETEWAMILPVMDPIRCDPRFAAIIQRLKTTDPYAAKVCAGKQ
jgi:TolB-like protein/Tfp pilus assembly protein PilF